MALILEILVLWFRIFCCYVEAFFRKIVPPSPKDVSGKLVLITGAGKGIGRALALEFAKHGARLALWDIDQKTNEETAAEIRAQGGEARAYVCDITKRDHVGETANQVCSDLGDVDILVNNAGIMICKDFLDLSEDEIRRTFEVNTLAQFWTVKEFLPAMLKKDSGHILNISSMAGLFGSAMLTDYSASKFGVVGFSQALLAEISRMKKYGVHVTMAFLMAVNTNLFAEFNHRVEFRDRFGKTMEPADVAKVLVDGVRRNQFRVFCPNNMKHSWFFEWLPMKSGPYMQKFIDAGFFPTKKTD